jgi:glycosyltransferase involved in cell wall biosynthesis
MNEKEKSVLFVSYYANRTGAPMQLFRLLKWIKHNNKLNFQILLLNGGDMKDEFSKLTQTKVLNIEKKIYTRNNLINKTFNTIRQYQNAKSIQSFVSESHFDLIIINSIGSASVIPFIEKSSAKVATYVHELQYLIEWVAGDLFEEIKKKTDFFFAVSEATKRDLVSMGVNEEKIFIVSGCIDFNDFDLEKKQEIRKRVRLELGLSESDKIVAGAGSMMFHKGIDIFLQILRKFDENTDGAVKWIWFGDFPDKGTQAIIEHDIRRLNLSDKLILPGVKENLADYLSAIDVFVLPSRGESFSLVSLEALSVGTPVVYFEGSGGPDEIVGTDCGMPVRYLDIQEAYEKINFLLNDDDLRKSMGLCGITKMREKYAVESVSKKFTEKIYQIVNENKY